MRGFRIEPQGGHPTKWNELRSKRKQVFGREITEVLQRPSILAAETLPETGAWVEFNSGATGHIPSIFSRKV
jgi:hypothetical protein